MKKIIISLLTLVTILPGCQDYFLDLDPLDSITEAVFWKSPEDFEQAANNLYKGMISWRAQEININGTEKVKTSAYEFMDFGTDLTSSTSSYGRGVVNITDQDVYWTQPYQQIRTANVLLEKAEEYGGDTSELAESVAIAKFFRAWHHFFLMQRYGGVIVVTRVLDLDSEELYGKRNSRYEVTAQILTDLTEAIPDLPLEQNIPASEKGRISRQGAQAFKSRVLLHEATWIKYVKTSTDGDGTTKGAGSAGYDESVVNDYLKEAAELADEVISSGAYELWNYNTSLQNTNGDGLSMLYLFNLEDENSNPAGLDKSTNKEFIIQSVYDYDFYKGQINLSHTVGYSLAPNRKMMDMMLCSDGLPVDKSPLFQGYQKVSDEYQNRDFRLASYFSSNGTWEIPTDGSITLTLGVNEGGYSNRKFYSFNYGSYRTAETESSHYSHLRLAEVYLNYAEALYELNGSITDDQLNRSINLTRKRAGLPNLTNSFVTANGLDMLTEIRRERAVELFGENSSRFNDLKRWGIAENELNQSICTMVIEGTDFENNENLYIPSRYVYGEESVYTGVGYRRAIIIDPASNRNFSRENYLRPIPVEELQLNENLLQNPGY